MLWIVEVGGERKSVGIVAELNAGVWICKRGLATTRALQNNAQASYDGIFCAGQGLVMEISMHAKTADPTPHCFE